MKHTDLAVVPFIVCAMDLLGVGLLQQGTPELVPLGRLGEHQLVVEGGDAVVNDNIHPVAIAPELQVKRSETRF